MVNYCVIRKKSSLWSRMCDDRRLMILFYQKFYAWKSWNTLLDITHCHSCQSSRFIYYFIYFRKEKQIIIHKIKFIVSNLNFVVEHSDKTHKKNLFLSSTVDIVHDCIQDNKTFGIVVISNSIYDPAVVIKFIHILKIEEANSNLRRRETF